MRPACVLAVGAHLTRINRPMLAARPACPISEGSGCSCDSWAPSIVTPTMQRVIRFGTGPGCGCEHRSVRDHSSAGLGLRRGSGRIHQSRAPDGTVQRNTACAKCDGGGAPVRPRAHVKPRRRRTRPRDWRLAMQLCAGSSKAAPVPRFCLMRTSSARRPGSVGDVGWANGGAGRDGPPQCARIGGRCIEWRRHCHRPTCAEWNGK